MARKLAQGLTLTLLTMIGLAVVAAPALTTIQDTIYLADGSTFNGTAYIQWKSFTAADSSSIGSAEIAVPIRNGQLQVKLVPTTNAVSGAFYAVRYQCDGKNQFNEIWVVRPSTAALKLKDIKIPEGGLGGISNGLGTTIAISDVEGLEEILNLKPSKGPGYTPSRTVVVNSQGQVVSALGSASDCVRVDGTAGPCGTPIVFVDQEVPAGAIDGINRTFTLGGSPSPTTSLHVYRNGILQRVTADFSLSGATVTFLPGSAPQPGDILLATYRK